MALPRLPKKVAAVSMLLMIIFLLDLKYSVCVGFGLKNYIHIHTLIPTICIVLQCRGGGVHQSSTLFDCKSRSYY